MWRVDATLEHPGLSFLCKDAVTISLHVSCKEYIVNVLSIIMCICLSTVKSWLGIKPFQQQCNNIGSGVLTLGTPNSSCSYHLHV